MLRWSIALTAGVLLAACATDAAPSAADTTEADTVQSCVCAVQQACGVDPCGDACGPGCGADGVCIAESCAPRDTCDSLGFTALLRTAELDRRSDGAQLEVRVDSRAQIPFERLVVQSFERLGGPTEPGVYAIDGSDYANCGLCVTAHDGCSAAGCARDFLADAGTVVIERLEAGDLALTVRDARLREISVNGRTLASTPVPGGDTWCIEDFDVTAPLVVHSETDYCSTSGTGRLIGDKIGDFTLTSCVGESVSLHDACGTARAVWLALATTWCSACAEHVPDVVATADAQRDVGLRALVVVGDDAITEESCREYAAQLGVDPAALVIDPGFATVEEHVELYSPGGLSLPWEGVLDAAMMRYVWAETAGEGSATDAIAELIGK